MARLFAAAGLGDADFEIKGPLSERHTIHIMGDATTARARAEQFLVADRRADGTFEHSIAAPDNTTILVSSFPDRPLADRARRAETYLVADILAREHLDTNARDGIVSRLDADREDPLRCPGPPSGHGADPHRIEVEIAAAPRRRGKRPPLAAARVDVSFSGPRSGHPPAHNPAAGSSSDSGPPMAPAASHDGQTAHMPRPAHNTFRPETQPAHGSADPNATPTGMLPSPQPVPHDDDDMDDAAEVPVSPLLAAPRG